MEPAVYVVTTDTPGMMELTLIVPYPSADPGYAHYVEHLTWRAAVQDHFDSSDTDDNAYTNRDVIYYKLSGPPEKLVEMLQTLARTQEPLELSEQAAKAERDVILREFDFRETGNLDEQATGLLDSYLFEGDRRSTSLIGTPAQIAAFSYRKAKIMHDATHGPGQSILFASGAVSPADLAHALVNAHFPALALRQRISPHLLIYPGGGRMTVELPTSAGTAPRLILRKLVPLKRPVAYELLILQCGLLQDILSSSLPGGLNYQLRYSGPGAEKLTIELLPHSERIVELSVWTTPDRGIASDALATRVEQSLAQLQRGISPNTYARILRRFQRDLADEKDSPKTQALVYQSRLLELRFPPPSDNVAKLTPKLDLTGVDSLASTVASSGRLAVAFIGKDRGL